MLLAVLAISATYVGRHLGRGWMPFDDGALAHTAERVLQGELPHRDFDDVYTGALAMWNAAAFRVFGLSLLSLRIALFVVFLAWVPAVYAIARRFLAPVAAGGITLLAVVWSYPNYPAAMPSWYNLFLATFGVAALLRYIEDGRARWLIVAGIAGGLSFLVKVVGLYYIAGVLLFLVFHAQEQDRAVDAPAASLRRGQWYPALVSLCLAVFLAALGALVRRQLRAPEVYQVVVPGTLIAAFLIRREWRAVASTDLTRLKRLLGALAPFLLGVAVPVVVFLIPYAQSSSLPAFLNGVFVLPTKRFSMASMPGLPVWTTLALVPPALLLYRLCGTNVPMRRRESAAWIVALVALLLVSGRNDYVYRAVWYAARNLLPVLTAVGVIMLSRTRAADAAQPLLRERLMLLLTVSAMCNLVQFPYSVPNYFCYVAPLVILLATSFTAHVPRASRPMLGALAAFYFAFAVVRINDSTLTEMGFVFRPYEATSPLRLARVGRMRIPTYQAEAFEQLIPMLRQRARGGYTWASPDAPQVYFLSGLKNPTRTVFDFFDDSTARTSHILNALQARGVTAIVLNGVPAFSFDPPSDLVIELERRYPFAANVGPFQLRWQR